MDFHWFQVGPIPNNAIHGTYNYGLVALSYFIAVLASYVALDLAGRLRAEHKRRSKLFWLLGGAVAMGAGIWSMHFVGMLAFIMPMPAAYNLFWTGSSLLIAILASGFALFLIGTRGRSVIALVFGGVLLGIGIVTMHYMGMEGMTGMDIRYLPSLFIASIIIAICASEAALWFVLKSNRGSYRHQLQLKIVSALIMGFAIAGMHYTGMMAAVFMPIAAVHTAAENFLAIKPHMLAFYVTGITGVIISIALIASTYKQLMISAVQNEKNFLNAMLDNLEDGIIACDPKGNITLINQTLKNKLNISENIKLTKEFWNYLEFHATDKSSTITKENNPLKRVLNGEKIHLTNMVIASKNRKAIDVVIDAQPIITLEGKRIGAVIVIHDITTQKKVEKMKSEFVSVVSHELRTPLTSIRGSLGLLSSGSLGSYSEKEKKLLDIASNNCERLLLLINDILDVEKIEAGKMNFQLQAIDVNQLVNEAISINKMYADKFEAKIKFSQTIQNIQVYADSNRLMQVLTNLISNAAKFSSRNGVIQIAISQSGENVRISVTDNGPGIPKEFQSQIFQKFSQADTSDTRMKGGTGLGLNITKAIIEKMNGTLNFVSVPNEETTFYFELPIWTSNTVKLKDETSEVELASSNRLLICEDDEDQAKYLSALLESAGFKNDCVYNATDAKKMLAKHTYHALLLDLILPDQDGISLIRELRDSEKTRTLPIIVLSMIAQTGRSVLNGEAFSVIDWLDKPIDLNKLLLAIKQIKSNKQTGAELPRILHVEDDIDTQNVIATLLEGQALVTSTATIHETREILAKKSFDLVVLDLLLPDGNSVVLLPLITQHKIPVVVYSAIELDHEHSKYVTQALIKSQITNEALLTTIQNILGSKKA